MTLGEFGGYPLPRTHDIAWEFKRCGITARVVADLAEARWRKLVWNMPFNGLTLLADGQRPAGAAPVSTADVLADEALAYLARRLMDEVIAAARKLGHPIPTDFADSQFKRTAEMGRYLPSTLLDYRRRPAAGTGSDLGRTVPARVQRRGGSGAAGNALLSAAVADDPAGWRVRHGGRSRHARRLDSAWRAFPPRSGTRSGGCPCSGRNATGWRAEAVGRRRCPTRRRAGP